MNYEGKKKLVLIFLLALCVRFTLLGFLHDSYFFSGITVGEGDLAHHLATGKGFVINKELVDIVASRQNQTQRLWDYEDFKRPEEEKLVPYWHALPGYPALLAVTYKIFGHERYIYLQILQAIADSFLVFAMFSIAAWLFNPGVGFFSALLFALWIPEARLSVAPLHDAPMTLILLLAAFFWIKYLSTNSKWFALAPAGIIGLGSFLRSDYIFLPVFFGVVLYLYKGEFKKSVVFVISSLLLIFLILFPWGMRNYHLFGKFQVTRATLWQSVWEGFGEFNNPFGAVLDDQVTFEQVKSEYPGIEYDSPQYQEALKRKVIRALRAYPIWYISILPRRLANMLLIRNFNDWGFPLDPKLSFRRLKLPFHMYCKYILKYPNQLFYRLIRRVCEPLLFFLALMGVWVYREEWKKTMLVFCIPVYAILSHLPVYWEPRYILPAQFPYLIFCVAFLQKLYWRLKNIRERLLNKHSSPINDENGC
jgi:4-amino-4-deoxy-L-arabinose transferase-like glycosyltransferase